jgi:hypothetical protein
MGPVQRALDIECDAACIEQGSGDRAEEPEEKVFVNTDFDEQAFLMFKLKQLAPLHNRLYSVPSPPPPPFGPYEKLNLLKGSTTALFNRICNSDFFLKQPLLDFTPAEFSELVPQLRLFKIYRDESGSIEREVEFKFPAFLDIEDVLSPSRAGYGLKSFEVDSMGTDFWQADKLFSAKMVLFFQSFDEVLKVRGSPQGDYSFLDLLVHPPAPPTEQDVGSPEVEVVSRRRYPITKPELFEIKVMLGWSMGDLTKSSTFSNLSAGKKQKYVEAVKSSNLMFFLTLNNHSFSINEDGTIVIDISYTGRMDFITKDLRSDFIKDQATKDKLDKKSQQIKDLVESKKNKSSAEIEDIDKKIEGIKKEQVDLNEQATKLAFSSIMNELITPQLTPGQDGNTTRISRMFQATIERDLLEDFIEYANAPSRIDAKDDKFRKIDLSNPVRIEEDNVYYTIVKPITVEDETIENYEKTTITINDAGDELVNITWFYLGDLFDIIARRSFRNSEDPHSFRSFTGEVSERVKVVLTDFEMIDYMDSTPIRVNLAHIPVSAKKFTKFFFEKVVADGYTNEYTFDEFMKDFLNDFVKDIFLKRNYIFNKKFRQQIDFRLSTVALPAVDGKDPMREKLGIREGDTEWSTIDVNKINSDNFITSFGSIRSIKDYYFYLVVHVNVNNQSLAGSVADDSKLGVPHLYIGRDSGAVKRVNFSKADFKYVREARIAAQAWDPIIQLTAKYHVDISMFGNTIFIPGMLLFLNPVGLGSTKLGMPQQKNSIASLMGLGGYHLVTNVTYQFEPGKFNTSVRALHQYSGSPADGKNIGGGLINYYGEVPEALGITDEEGG